MTTPSDDRSPIALAVAWAYRIMTVSLEMVVPGVIGYAIDRWLGTVFLLALVGFAGGMTLAIWHLILMAREPPDEQSGRGEGVEGKRKS